MAFLQLKNIKKSFYLGKKEFPVLKDISVNFERGEFVSILGESGGGKTTLLNIIGGLDSQYEGDVLLDNTSVKSGSEKGLDAYRSKTIGFIFQSFHLISHLTILQNVMVPLEMSNLSHSKRVKRAQDLLKQVGLEEHMSKHPGQLSGGQKQRVAIARALANDPDIIIADEPTGALDSQNTDEILDILNDISKQGKLVIAVTHSDKVANYGTRVIHIVDGQVDSDTQLRDKAPDVEKKVSDAKVTHLSFRNTFSMALNHMRYYLGRNLLIIFGSMIGIFSVIFMLGLGNGVTGYITSEMNKTVNPTAIQVTKNVTSSDPTGADIDPSDINITDKNEKTLKKIDNVNSVEEGYFVQGAKLVANDKSAQEQFFQTFNKTIKTNDIKQGTKPGKNEILITKAQAKKFNKKDYKSMIGKKVNLFLTTTNADKQPVQVQRELTVSGIIKSGTSSISYNTLKSMFTDQGIKIQPNFVTVNVDKTQDVKAVQTKIKNYEHKDAKGKTVKTYQITGVGAIIDTLNTYLQLAFNVLAAIAGISLLVSAIMIIVVLYISVSERTKEIGILRAIGARRKDIRNLFISEAFLLGLFSSILAVGVAYLVQMGANSISMSALKMPIIDITTGNAIFGILVSVIISLLAALAPSRRAAKLDPRETLTDE
ncbi:ABC transporter ATP-binding protein [Companilactobacillus sp. RD055328]|uniref:ABC transporter ATP-binding protein/permease n=1 Tax=Companilactobacillus sp. RD055328 TaxID=2916634 RepID=UPI001FC85392|nr:ABC transporter ATP-binding protein/permease [Companilactobacillus sp. RD055328]GKQ43253.1 ABC transporter ATP-binding protein [Companilactobacillus sp. RD055328]